MEMVLALLKYYSFDLGGYTVADLARAWQRYDSEWVRHAVIECLYRGRYKAVSVHQILQQWTRRGEPLYHYGKDFERFICHDVPLQMRQASDNLLYFSNQSPAESPVSGNNTSANLKSESESITNSHPPANPTKSSPRSTMGRRSGGRRYPEKQTPATPQPNQALPNIEPKSYRSDVYGTALDDMRLLAKASIFTNKLRSMCQDPVDLAPSESSSAAIPELPTGGRDTHYLSQDDEHLGHKNNPVSDSVLEVYISESSSEKSVVVPFPHKKSASVPQSTNSELESANLIADLATPIPEPVDNIIDHSIDHSADVLNNSVSAHIATDDNHNPNHHSNRNLKPTKPKPSHQTNSVTFLEQSLDQSGDSASEESS